MELLLRNLGSAWGQECARAAYLLVRSVWQGVVLVAGVALLLRCVPRLTAAARSAVWTAVLLLTVTLPVFSWNASGAPAGGRTLMHANAAWSFGLVGVWAGLSLLRLVQLGANAIRLWGIARRAVQVEAPAAIRPLLERNARRVSLCASGDVGRPSVAGFFRPGILLPTGLLETLSEAELEHVVLHELEHLRRRDDWTNLLQKLSLALFPLHPALHWLDRRMCLERELACDDGVLRVTRARKAYAACLARLAEDSMVRRGLSLALGLLGVKTRGSELGSRVNRILRSPAVAMGRIQAAIAMGVLLGVVLGGSMLLARSPQLVSFAAAAGEQALATAEPAPASREMHGDRVAESPYRAVQAKALMPQARIQATPRLVRTVAPIARKRRSPQRQVARAEAPRSWREPGSYEVVLTTWQQTSMAPRLTLAVARIQQDPQSAYAAVPVRGGWLLFQL